jgi:hypothetical protein
MNNTKNLNKIKAVLKEFACPKYNGMSLTELARIVNIAANDYDEEDDDEDSHSPQVTGRGER